MQDNLDTFPTTASRDLMYLFVGERIGCGMSRVVYECSQDKDCVIKHEEKIGHFQNVIEWEIWNMVVGTELEKWFAPCISISHNGLFLIQKKIGPIAFNKYPEKVPAFFGDMKYKNFGMYNKHFVVCDYGNYMGREIFTKRMIKARWGDWK